MMMKAARRLISLSRVTLAAASLDTTSATKELVLGRNWVWVAASCWWLGKERGEGTQ